MLKPVKRPKSPYYVARGTINGQRVEKSTGETTLAAARQACERIAAEILASDPDQVSKGRLTVKQAATQYRAAGKDGRFLTAIETHFGDTPVSAIDPQAMRKAAKAIYPNAASATLRRQLYTPMKAIINHCADEGLCAPIRLKSPKDGNKRTQFLTPAQAEKVILAFASEKNRYLPALITGLFGQGMRLGEALSIDGSDVSLEHKFAILRNTKNGEERTITLTGRTIAAWSLLPTVGKPGPLFRREDGLGFRLGKNSGGQIAKQFRRAVCEAGFDPAVITPHICRHSWATWFYAQVVDVLRLRDEGGWKSNEWQRYTRSRLPSIGEEARKLRWDFVGENRGKETEGPSVAAR